MAARHKAVAVLIALASICLAATGASRAGEITLYSTREVALVAPVVAAFTEASGVKVDVVFVEDSLVKRLASEGETSPADVLLTIGLDKTTQLSTRGLTQAVASPHLEQAVPAHLRGAGAQWITLAIRPRIVLMRKDSALAAIDYEDLAGPQWRGKLCMRSALHQNNVALVAAYLVHHGEAATEVWLSGLKSNLVHRPDGKDNDVIREIAQGICEIGIANTVALAQLRDGREGADLRAWAMKIKAMPTTFKSGGTHVNLTGAAIAKHAPHPQLARQLLEFLVTPAAQRIFAAAELEYPVLAEAERAPIVAEIGSFAADGLPIDEIAGQQQAAIALIKKVGFDD
ncbi:extracellular solute-binding protein [Bradyrhizobium diazoefficiens]|nr:extracellular solute-binding protein [Bradyrhizobium diazoefficiens]UCF54813.1 MAG: extracellular solute-binding protein [Bradyrhizobium sp.]MBR0966702.1 extracellular solute-binding protein [Bradyrhizobium diazoefficiens]MBR0980214.1 extracellular solute-binding protein [Bradyrhizobium diazoefficiens]MBR1009562.1 extracellular solute-binding protein [Bradyrhizobium diazoefficiens]MBR1016145.1 extracellular solute-binding protein [Bradyrhizobium diazoefficiens]